MDDLQTFGVSAHSQFMLLGKHLDERKRAQEVPEAAAVCVAETESGAIPPRFAFRTVVPQTLTTTDVTFLDRVTPRTDHVVILVTGGAHPIYLTAKVLYSQTAEEYGPGMYSVGCQFLRRVES